MSYSFIESSADICAAWPFLTLNSTPYFAQFPHMAAVTTYGGYLYFRFTGFACSSRTSAFAAFTLSHRSGAVLMRYSASRFVTKDVFTVAPFSYVMSQSVGR